MNYLAVSFQRTGSQLRSALSQPASRTTSSPELKSPGNEVASRGVSDRGKSFLILYQELYLSLKVKRNVSLCVSDLCALKS